LLASPVHPRKCLMYLVEGASTPLPPVKNPAALCGRSRRSSSHELEALNDSASNCTGQPRHYVIDSLEHHHNDRASIGSSRPDDQRVVARSSGQTETTHDAAVYAQRRPSFPPCIQQATDVSRPPAIISSARQTDQSTAQPTRAASNSKQSIEIYHGNCSKRRLTVIDVDNACLRKTTCNRRPGSHSAPVQHLLLYTHFIDLLLLTLYAIMSPVHCHVML